MAGDDPPKNIKEARESLSKGMSQSLIAYKRLASKFTWHDPDFKIREQVATSSTAFNTVSNTSNCYLRNSFCCLEA